MHERHDGRSAPILAGDDHMFADHVRTELLGTVSRQERAMLVRSSPFDRLSGGLCDAVLERCGSGRLLRDLSRSGAVIPLDRRDHAYRLHGMVAEALLAELRRTEPQLEAAMRARASEWLEQAGDAERAIEQAIAAGDAGRAAALLSRRAASLALDGRRSELARWRELLDPREIATDPVLAVAAATSSVIGGECDVAEHWTDVADRTAPTTPDTAPCGLAAAIAALRAAIARDGVAQMQRDAAHAYATSPVGSAWRAIACLLEGVALHMTAQTASARVKLIEGLRLSAASLPLARASSRSFSSTVTPAPAAVTLAELRVMRFLPTHMSFREIAARLQVSPPTVKTQALAVYRKLDASSRSEAVARARALGLVGG